MRTTISRILRLGGVLFALALLAPFLQPGHASAAAPILGLSKAVAAGTSGFGTSQNAPPGTTLTYQLTYSNTGTAPATPLTVTDVLAAGQTLTSYSSGCSSSLTGGGLTQVTCTVANVPAYPTTDYVGTLYIQTTVNGGYAGTLYNTAHASAPATATHTSNTVTVNVTGPPPPSNFSLQKYVAVNGYTYGTTATAHVGDTLTYWLQFNNNTGVYLSTVTFSDTLAPGQAFLYPPSSSSACAVYNMGSRTVTCTLYNVAPGSTSVYIQTGVQNGYGSITNQATVVANGITVYSNPVYVNVGQPVQYFTGNFTICGTVTSFAAPSGFSSGAIGFFGHSYTLNTGTTIGGQSIYLGMNGCFTFTVNTLGQIVAVAVTPNLSGLNVVCGVYSPSGVANTIVLSGYTFYVNGNFLPLLTPGYLYCFVVDNSGVAYILLSTIPTGIGPAHGGQAVSIGGGRRAIAE